VSKFLIEVDGVSKAFPQSKNNRHRLSAIWRALKGQSPSNTVTVLEDISLQVSPGRSVALLGANGAGKSTLLKLVCGVLQATKGSITVKGSIGAMLELGAGFNPDFTGRENIALSAALMGLNHKQQQEQEAGIIEFADIGSYLDQPVKHYSSGMVVRLGFAILTGARPDVLVTDEVLGVGDESFQRKCQQWLDEYLSGGGTLLLVSHGMDVVRRLCSHAIWLDQGQIKMEGEPDSVCAAYLHWQDAQFQRQQQDATVLDGSRYQLLKMLANGHDVEAEIRSGSELRISLELFSPDDRPPVVAIGIKDQFGTAVYGTTSEIDGAKPEHVGNNRYVFEVRFPELVLLPGAYQLNGHAMDPEGMRLFDTLSCTIQVLGKSQQPGAITLNAAPIKADEKPKV